MVKFRVLAGSVLLVSLAFVFVCLVGLIISGEETRGGWTTAFVVSLLGGLIGFTFYGLARLLMAIEVNTFRMEETLERLIRRIDGVKDRLDAMNESILLNDEAKTIAFRDKDLHALRQAVEEKIVAEEWQKASYLTDQMESRFDARQEADQLRVRMAQAKEEQYRRELRLAVAGFEDRLKAYEWTAAAGMIENIKKRFPKAPEAGKLAEKLEQARAERKKYLIQQWDNAIQKDEAERGIEILKELDQYLTPNEAAALEESARGAFRAKLHNMGVQFSLLVTEKIWDRAMALGQEIIREFPNSRMAQEIQEGIPGLEAKARAMQEEWEEEKVSS
jgi:hypothetical protein